MHLGKQKAGLAKPVKTEERAFIAESASPP
jgi:hypothetical protein